MGTTPTYVLPYPEQTDPADVPVDIRELADRLEVVLPTAGPFRYRGALTPAAFGALTGHLDGDVVDLIVDSAAGIIWRFRYRTASASAYKWEFLGGAPLRAVDDVGHAYAGTVYGEDATLVRVTCPRPGEYDAEFGVRQWMNAAGTANALTTVQVAGVAPANDDGAIFNVFTVANQQYYNQSRKLRPTVLAANDTLRMVHKIIGNAITVTNRWLSVLPVRIS